MKPELPAALSLETRLLNVARWPSQAFDGPQPAIHAAGTVFFPDADTFRRRDWTRKDAFIYGTHGTPTTFELEARVAALEGGSHSLLLPSGLAAIAILYQALLQPGDELLVPLSVYSANREFITNELVRWGVSIQLYDPTDLNTLAFSPASRLLWIDAPGTTTFEFPDIRQIAVQARANNVLVAMDSTWSAGIAFRPFDFPIDVSVHSLSKFACGSGDTLLGCITCADKGLFDVIRVTAARHGQFVSSEAAASVAKGLDTLPIRYRAQDASTRRLIDGLIKHSRIQRVFHPSLPTIPGHDIWKTTCSAAAGLFSIELESSLTQSDADQLIDSVKLFRIGFGWGGHRSLMLPCGVGIVSPQQTYGEIIRVAVGLEDPTDLLNDLVQALDRLPK